MKTFSKYSFTALILLIITAGTAEAQQRPDEGSVGLSASLQGNQVNIMVPIWASDDMVIAPVFGVVNEAENFTSINLGVKPKFYQELGSNFASYFGALGLIQHTSPEVGDNVTDFLIGANGGGEYFFDSRFSVGVEGQLNLLIRGDSENRLATGAAVTASYYF